MKTDMKAAQARLCENADFKEWLYAALDDLCLFARDEGMLTDFGQGIRAAANRIKNRILQTEEGVEMLTGFARRDFDLAHKAFKEADKPEGKNQETRRLE